MKQNDLFSFINAKFESEMFIFFMKSNLFSKFSAFPGLSIGPVQNYRFELSKVDNNRWPRMTFYDILMKIGWNIIVGFYNVLKLFIRCLK